MKTSELSGPLLAEWVARAQGWLVAPSDDQDQTSALMCWEPGREASFGEFGYRPDLNWAQGGPIIERCGIELLRNRLDNDWVACYQDATNGAQISASLRGSTSLIAAMRTFVASKYGDTVLVDILQ